MGVTSRHIYGMSTDGEVLCISVSAFLLWGIRRTETGWTLGGRGCDRVMRLRVCCSRDLAGSGAMVVDAQQ